MELAGHFGYSRMITLNTWFWRQLCAEFLGTFLVVLFTCGSTISGLNDGDIATITRIAFAAGFSVAAVVEVIGDLSGAHVNPAVTVAMLFVRRIQILPGLLYIFVQFVGGSFGAAFLKTLVPANLNSTFGLSIIDQHLSVEQGLGVEFFVTCILVLVIFAVTDKHRPNVQGAASAAIGTTVIAAHLFAIPYTGCGLNPARVFASAAVTKDWTNQWVYWLGELTGALFAALLYVIFLVTDKYGIYYHFYLMWCSSKYRVSDIIISSTGSSIVNPVNIPSPRRRFIGC